jgi:hypothetical protein
MTAPVSAGTIPAVPVVAAIPDPTVFDLHISRNNIAISIPVEALGEGVG